MKNEILEKQLRLWADEAISACPTMDGQKKYIRDKVFANKKIVEQLAMRALDDLSMNILYLARHATKATLNNNCMSIGAKPSRRTPDVIKAALGLLDSYFCGDKPIGDCTGAEVLEQAMRHQAIANGNQQQANIFFAVADKCKGKKLVRKNLTEAQFAEIINKEKTKEATA